MNFMLAYGAAESSIYALQKFKLLDILLPIQVSGIPADLSEQYSQGVLWHPEEWFAFDSEDKNMLSEFDWNELDVRFSPTFISMTADTSIAVTMCASIAADPEKGTLAVQHVVQSIIEPKLFSTADKYFSTDRPANGKLWSAIMAFHLALVENPQDSLVVWTFSTILYRGTWNNAIEIAKQNERVHHVQFIPEIHASINPKSDEEILEEVSHLASLIKTSVNSLTSIDALEKSLGRYGNPPSSRMTVLDLSNSSLQLITSKRMGKDVATLFDVLESKIKSYNNKREGCQINYELLKKGNADEIRFVLGKIIMETMNSKSSVGQSQIEHVQSHNHPQLSSLFK
ncbi:hypothetical protein ZIOFF_022971 [Zingiber officinale]|uniref:Uncharacterized protein n=1 Tax=Zingiber officinale TaxID=94328 RepID=A0A8J5HDI8_ZINOF|nr:hypothetical protein ZIOFF_022971 [Zingiber officinale]